MPTANQRARLARLKKAAIQAAQRAGCGVIYMRDGETLEQAVRRYKAMGHAIAGGLLFVREPLTAEQWSETAPRQQRESIEETRRYLEERNLH